MLGLAIGILVGFGVTMLTSYGLGPIWGIGPVWGTVCGMVALVGVQIAIGLWVRKKVNAVNAKIQNVMEELQRKVNRKIQMFQQRPGGNLKVAQQMLEKDQLESIRESIAITSEAEAFYKWNLLLKKQINTMRMLLYFQIREFDKVDELIPQAMFFDVRSLAVKMVRMYKKDDPKLDAFYRKKVKKFKGDDLALLASLYSFIQLKRDNAEGALQTLIEAKKKTDSEVVAANWEALANGKPKQYSNAALGDAWYSLYLEEPKVKQQRVRDSRPF